MNKTLIQLLLPIILLSSGRLGFAQSNFDLYFKDISKYDNVIVQEVISPDTLKIENYQKKGELIKLIGVKAPKPPRRNKNRKKDKYGFVIPEEINPVTPVEERAMNYANDLLLGKRIRLEFDSQLKDEEQTTQAYVFLIDDELFVNHEILRQGFAHLKSDPINTKYKEKLRSAYLEAKREKRGLQLY